MIIPCAICGVNVDSRTTHKVRICSKKCRLKRRSLLEHKHEGYKEKSCIICDISFKPITSTSKVCALDACQLMARRQRKNRLQKAYHQRHKKSPAYRFKRFLLTTLRRMILHKKHRSFTYINYTKQEFIKDIENKMLPGMNWGNYGEWHIDHKKPLYKFNFINEHGQVDMQQMLLANDLTNLQPLWAVDNLRKNKKYDL